MGGLGSGTVAKLVNNMLSFCNMAALSEGMMLGTSYGLDPEKLLHVISTSSGNSNAIKNFTLRALPGKYSPPSFALDLAYKDLHLALELGDELGVPLYQGASTHNLQRLAKGMGFGPDDSTSVLRVTNDAGPQGQVIVFRTAGLWPAHILRAPMSRPEAGGPEDHGRYFSRKAGSGSKPRPSPVGTLSSGCQRVARCRRTCPCAAGASITA